MKKRLFILSVLVLFVFSNLGVQAVFAEPVPSASEEVDHVDGTILDVNANWILFRDNASASGVVLPHLLAVKNRSTGDITTLFNDPFWSEDGRNFERESAVTGYLTASGAITVINDRDTRFNFVQYKEWKDGSVTKTTGITSVEQAGGYVFKGDYALRYRGEINLKNWATAGPYTAISANGRMISNSGYDLAANGRVAYANFDNTKLFTYLNGVTTPITNDDVRWVGKPIIDENNIIYARTTDNIAYQTILNDGTGETVLTTSSTQPIAHKSYDFNNGWIAFTKYNEQAPASKQTQLWIRSPRGTENQIPTADGTSHIVSLNANGEVVYADSSNALHYFNVNNSKSIAIGQAEKVFCLEDAVYATTGGTLYKFTANTPASNVASLSSLQLSGISLDQTVSENVYTYTATVPNDVSVTTATYATVDNHATVALQLNGAPVNNPISLNVGSNVINVIVTAQDGSTKTYTVTVIREGSNNAALSALSLSDITLEPSVSENVYTYTATVPNYVSVTTATYTTVDSHAAAALQLDGAPVNNPISLNVGANVISVVVTAQDGSTKTYTITVTRGSRSSSGGSTSSSSSGSTGGSTGGTTPATPTTPVAPVTPTAPTAPTHIFTDPINDLQLISFLKDRIAQAKSSPASIHLSDISNHWSKDTILLFVKLGVVSGYEDGSFQPDARITRAEFATIISKVFNLHPTSNTSAISDVDIHWAKESINALASHGIINGYEDGTFKPDHTITRAEIIAIISRLVDLHAVKKSSHRAFIDIDGSWNKAQIQAASDAGLVEGRDASTFSPDASSTKAESLTIVLRVLELNPDIKALLDQLR